jgi:hypothetical protein
MARRQSRNVTGLKRIEGIDVHAAWAAFQCLSCSELNLVHVGGALLDPKEALRSAKWACKKCKYLHSAGSKLPFKDWPAAFRSPKSLQAQRFWQGFFRVATEHASSYWKQCNACGRIQPFNAFSKHTGWGPLERQMECRGCKGAINAELNPLRTAEQMHESSLRRRVADLLLKGENRRVAFKPLFERFEGRCFKTGKKLTLEDRRTWAIDHVLPSRYLYPLSDHNAALLSVEANNAKRDRWPSEFYTNNQLIRLAKLIGADLGLLASKAPVLNPNINVNACVSRFLKVRERSNLPKRIAELKKLLRDYDLVKMLSPENRRLLGL